MNMAVVGDIAAARQLEHRIGWCFGFRALIAVVLLLPSQWALSAPLAVTTTPFLMGTDTEETTLVGKWYRRIYNEAFRRMGVPLAVVVLPTARLTTMADEGEVHGQASRLASYAEAHPEQLRVDEVVHEARLALYGFDPTGNASYPAKLADLNKGKWLVEYRRGIVACDKTLRPIVPADKLADATNEEQGLKKLKAGRIDLYCDFDLVVQGEMLTPAFKGVAGFNRVIDLGVKLPLYPYVHKSRADLVPKLAAAISKMKTEGLIDRYFRDARTELEAQR